MNERADKVSTGVQSVAVATEILKVLADEGLPVRVTDMARRLSMTKARVSRHLSTLANLGLVSREPGERGYRLGWLIFQLGQKAAAQYQVASKADPFLHELRNAVDEAVLIAIPVDGDAVVVSSLRSGKTVSPHLIPGQRLRVPSSPSACVLLAFAADHIRNRTIKQSSRKNSEQRITDVAGFKSRLDDIRENFIDWHQDPHLAGFSVVAAPVFGHTDEIEASITVVMPAFSQAHEIRPEIISSLQKSAAELSSALGSQRWNERIRR